MLGSPLNHAQVCELVERGEFILPTSKEIEGISKSDVVGKLGTVSHTIWFIAQCVVRRVGRLAFTHLEIVTLAYTIITVTMYIAWWHKPSSVDCPMRVPITLMRSPNALIKPRSVRSIWKKMFAYTFGNQDVLVELRQLNQVPMFWSNDPVDIFNNSNTSGIDSYFWADVLALVVTMAFGAMHCIAWSYAMLTPLEQIIWRVSAVTIVAAPAVIMLAYLACLLPLFWGGNRPWVKAALKGMVAVVGVGAAVVYMITCVMLLVVSLTTLHSLPLAAYQVDPWPSYIPHVTG